MAGWVAAHARSGRLPFARLLEEPIDLAERGVPLTARNADWAARFTFKAEPIAWTIILYGLAASVLPIWLLLAPRDYLSTFMKLGTIFALVLGVFLVLPDLKMPAISKFIDGSGLVVAGKLFPLCFITNSYAKVSPGLMCDWVRPPTPSMPFGSRTPCQ